MGTIGFMSADVDRAEELIAELGTLAGRTRAAGRSMATGVPLIGWGLAWGTGYVALDLLDGAIRIVVVALAWCVGLLGSWLPVRNVIRTGIEGRIRWGWAAVLFASPFLITAAQPASWVFIALFLGGLWSLAMCLYAVATADVPYAVVGMIGVVMAAVAGVQTSLPPLACFGIAAALPLLGIGVHRTVTGARHV